MTHFGDPALVPDDLPAVIRRYQAAHDRRDTEAAFATFAPDPLVVDDGHTYRGGTEVHDWLSTASSEFTFTRTLLSVERTGVGTWRITNRIEGNFPGGQVDLRYGFAVADDLITELVIEP